MKIEFTGKVSRTMMYKKDKAAIEMKPGRQYTVDKEYFVAKYMREVTAKAAEKAEKPTKPTSESKKTTKPKEAAKEAPKPKKAAEKPKVEAGVVVEDVAEVKADLELE